MKKIALLLSILLAAALPAFAADTKYEGEAVCAKCQLHVADKCRAAVVITGADGKKETYLSEANAQAKDLHSEICKGGKPVTVEGTLSEKNGEKIITINKYDIKK